ncbi:imidazole glycerol phosphate synthase subunit HisH, partial [bacterium]|nr:imidazole glycerol phosphate synthase subunit HisH [bacterium]
HSYYVSPDSASLTAATTDYEGAFTSVAAKGSVFGVQFHPEKSAVVGERMLANFARRAGVTATC